MGKIKDFFYNTNDILVALIIIALAAGVIYLRIQDFIHYPATLAKTASATTTTQTTAPTTANPTPTSATTAPTVAPTSTVPQGSSGQP